MTNDIGDTNPEDAVPCFALSKNDSYVLSASGGKISLFNMMTFKVNAFAQILLYICSSNVYLWTNLFLTVEKVWLFGSMILKKFYCAVLTLFIFLNIYSSPQ